MSIELHFPVASRATIISIRISLCNDEKDVAEAVENLFAQMFTDFELIISDAPSTNGTRGSNKPQPI